MGGDGIKSDKMGVTGNVRKHPMGEQSPQPNSTTGSSLNPQGKAALCFRK